MFLVSFSFTFACGYVTPPPTQSSPSSFHMPVINPHLYTSAWSHDHSDDATGKRSQDLRQRAPQATYFLHWNPTCREPRLLGIQATRTGSAPRCTGKGKIDWFPDEPIRERSRASVGDGQDYTGGVKGKGAGMLNTRAQSSSGPTVTNLGILV